MVHKRFPGSHPPRTYCGLPITQTDVRVSGGTERVDCRSCLRLAGAVQPRVAPVSHDRHGVRP